MKNIEILVFDCDGVLFNSLDANIAFYNTVLEKLGEAPMASSADPRAAECHIGSSPQVFAALLGEERVEAAMQVVEQINYADFFPWLQPEPGVYECLAELAQYLPLAVATNRRGSMHDIVTHFKLERFFTHLVTSSDVARPKPYPDMLYRVSALAECDAARMVYVGDSEYDRLAAQRAGVDFMAYKWDGGQRVESHWHLLEMIKERLVQ